jgi:hypothetical protein
MFSWSILFLVGLFLGAWLFYVVLFPLVYGLPRAVYGCVKGAYRWGIVRRMIVAPAIWSLLCGVAIAEALSINADVITNLLLKRGILWGGWAALTFGLCSLFSDAVKRDFDWKSEKYIRTSGEQRPREECAAKQAANVAQSNFAGQTALTRHAQQAILRLRRGH